MAPIEAAAVEPTTALLPDSISRFNRFRSALSSAALWHRSSRSFSSALLMIRSNSGGISGFKRTEATGLRFRIASKITADVSPRKGSEPVVISYSTAPNENKSVRASSSLPRACSGDM